MLTNADCTIYEKDTYTRHFIPEVYWDDDRGHIVTKIGAQIENNLIVYIYDNTYIPKAGDIIVRGECEYIFDAASEQAVSESMKAFRMLRPDFSVVKDVKDGWYGGLPHYELTAR